MRIVDALFPVADPDALGAWYDDALGARPSFVPGEAAPHHFAFHVVDLEPWKQRLDVTEEHDFSSWGGARSVYFRDPEENVVELISRPRPWPELWLAEVGLPVEDVGAAVESLQTLGLPIYDEWSDSFAPLGDDEGLLIVVHVGRGWFPVGVPAGNAPITVTIAGLQPGEVTVPGSGHRIVAVT